MSDFTKKWRVTHDEPLTYNERIINSACDIIKELEDSDAWRKSATEFYENGGCPLCFSTDEAGCNEGCYFGQLQMENERYKIALQEIIVESGDIEKSKWPTQQQKCFAIAQQALKD